MHLRGHFRVELGALVDEADVGGRWTCRGNLAIRPLDFELGFVGSILVEAHGTGGVTAADISGAVFPKVVEVTLGAHIATAFVAVASAIFVAIGIGTSESSRHATLLPMTSDSVSTVF
jgi:hypothetical protein